MPPRMMKRMGQVMPPQSSGWMELPLRLRRRDVSRAKVQDLPLGQSFGKAKPSKKGGNPPSSPAKVPLDQAQKALDLLKAVDAEDEEFTDQMTDVISGPSMDPETFQSVMTTVASKAAAEAFEFPLQFPLCYRRGHGPWPLDRRL